MVTGTCKEEGKLSKVVSNVIIFLTWQASLLRGCCSVLELKIFFLKRGIVIKDFAIRTDMKQSACRIVSVERELFDIRVSTSRIFQPKHTRTNNFQKRRYGMHFHKTPPDCLKFHPVGFLTTQILQTSSPLSPPSSCQRDTSSLSERDLPSLDKSERD
jgi:hypothetical protein